MSEAAQTPTVMSPHRMASYLLRHFLFATEEVFRTQLSMKIEKYSLAVKPGEPLAPADIASVINIVSSSHQCTVVLSFPKATFLNCYQQMLGERPDAISKDNADAACEWLNMIFGVAKTKFNPEGHDFLMAIPTLISGEALDLSCFHKTNLSRVVCATEVGSFYIDLSVAEIKEYA